MFEINDYRTPHTGYDHAVKNDRRKYNVILEITTDQGDDDGTGCLLDYPYSKNII